MRYNVLPKESQKCFFQFQLFADATFFHSAGTLSSWHIWTAFDPVIDNLGLKFLIFEHNNFVYKCKENQIWLNCKVFFFLIKKVWKLNS